MPLGVKILRSMWLVFFLLSIVLVGTFFAVPFYLPVWLVAHVFPRLSVVNDRIMCFGIRVLMALQPWFRGEVRCALPKSGPTLLVSNHRSHLDAFVLLSRVRGIRLFAMSSLFKIPGLAFMMRASRQIKVEKSLDGFLLAMEQVRERLHGGHRVHVFPELTRCKPGFQGVAAFTAAPFLAAIQEDAQVVPIAFWGTDDVWPRGAKGLAFRAPVRMVTLPPLRARDFASADELRGEVHKRIADALA